MLALGLVELQRPGDCFEHALRDPTEIPPFEAVVVVDADPGEHGDLLPPEPGNAPLAAVRGQSRPLRRDPGSPGGQKLPNVVPSVHRPRLRTPRGLWGVLSLPGPTEPSLPR